jgi:hypothetical protein
LRSLWHTGSADDAVNQINMTPTDLTRHAAC